MKRNLLFWIPVQFIQFGYIQEDLQIPFLSLCGLAWTFIISISAGSTKQYNASPEDEIVEEMMKPVDPTEPTGTPVGQTANANAIWYVLNSYIGASPVGWENFTVQWIVLTTN